MEKIVRKNYSKIIFSDEEEKEIVDMYVKQKMSTVAIGKIYGCTHKPITKVLKKYEINRVGNGRRQYNLNEHYFDKIDTPNKAYILGFLYADGYNGREKATVTMSLQEEDGYILEQIRQELESEKPLEYLDYSNKHDFGYTYKNQYRLLMFSAHMCDQLASLGMVPNKSLVLEFPSIPEHLYSHFIRGYFDGDGSLCLHITKTGRKQSLITFTSTDSLCYEIQSILKQVLDISGGGIYDASCHNGVTKVLSYCGNRQVKTILDYLYKDADMYLTRKHDKYLSIFYK